ncbi:hypothetical protein HA50_22615 [Pantoea cypripedii]|uniref:HTH araC/xylS-type domain-containing protein n=2 Tax=Pantoea cypripedii TaxID=55209 RepID=A0A1X1EN16_PANCY|nr:hypothetical protein HA50_22615 [Pantoea cypripedii]
MEYHFTIVETLIDWIDKNLSESLQIDDIAEKSGFSKWYLQRIFLRVTSRNIAEFIRDSRLNKAAVDLANTNDHLIEISMRYGYETQQSFSRAFKSKFDIPPGRYRKKHSSSYFSKVNSL